MKSVSKAVGNKNLLKLAAFLEKLPRKRFDYSVYVGTDWEGEADLSCGTVACALGWATTIPAFRKYGLRLSDIDNHPSGASTTGDDDHAGNALFALDNSEWRYLFLPERYCPWSVNGNVNGNLPLSPHPKATAKQVAKHIRRFVAARRAI